MGLDGVELVMAFEESFGLEITDAEASAMSTPRAVIDYVCQRRGPGTRVQCQSQRAFFAIRNAFMKAGRQRGEVRPETRLAALLPRPGRREAWPVLRGPFTKRQWPDLQRPPLLVWSSSALVLVIGVVAALWLDQRISWSSPFVTGGIVAGLLGWAVATLSRPFACCFPVQSVGELARNISAGGRGGLLREDEELDRNQIAEIVRAVIIEQLGISPEQYGEDKAFVRDFGVG
ncbi:MAG: hypothetical protein K8R23_18200 [Chthoniobacter sp.]|nr:hypothetical protein [Chthoniobacter sp.]